VRLFTSRPLAWIRLLRSVQPALIHFNNSFNGDHDLIVAARLLGIPCVAHQRGVPGVTGRVEVMFSRGFAAIIAISTAIRDDILGRGVDPRRVRLIHDGIDPDRVVVGRTRDELRQSLGLRPSDRVIGMVGNVKPWKGQHVLIGALARLRAAEPDLHCIFVGTIVDEGYYRHLDELLASGAVRDRAHFVGFDRNPADFVNLMEVAVHASVEPEPFGLVVVEAMALGKPVVATTIGGPRDVVVDGVTGYLCPPGDDAAVARRLAGLLADPARARQMGTAGRERLLSSFTSAVQVRSIEHLYDELLHR
jgi:glycosyltransferase involved in cell wall biosynthesis